MAQTKEQKAIKRRAYRAKYSERYAARVKAWRIKNRDYVIIKRKIWGGTLIGILCMHLNNIKNTRSHIECSIIYKDLMKIYEKQKGLCCLTGRRMCLKRKGRPDSMSVDRINSKKGYIKGNVRLVTWQANSAKGRSTDNQLLTFCQDVLKHHKLKQRRNKS